MGDFHRERCKTDKGMVWNDLVENNLHSWYVY